MISHKYKCIFIHIPRTAGTSIEHWIYGNDWWEVDKRTKHLTASQAKKIYRAYWDSYFKFSFVRNPWSRCVSCLTYSDHFGIAYDAKMNVEGYKKKFGFPTLVEHDYRFYDAKDIINDNHQERTVYQNILDEEIDFIGKFENLKKDINYIKKTLGIKKRFYPDKKILRTRRATYRNYYDQSSMEEIRNMYWKDILKFNYSF